MKRKALLLLLVMGVLLTVLLFIRKNGEIAPVPDDEVTGNANPPISSVQESVARKESKNSNTGGVEQEPRTPQGPPTFRNGSLEFTLEFEDPSLDAAQAQRIAEDLNNVFSHLTAKPSAFDAQKRLVFEGKGRSWPDALDIVWAIREAQGNQFLKVPISVTDSYKEAFEFIEEHEVEESEVFELVKRIEVGASKSDSVVALSVGSVSDEKLSEALNEMSKGQVKTPSPLAYRLLDTNGSEALIAETLFLEFDGETVTHAEGIRFIRIGNEWKIAL